MPRKDSYRGYDKEGYDKEMRRKRAIERLGIALEYEGPLSNRGVPLALGNFILERWRTDDSNSSHTKVERLLDALQAHPEVSVKEIEGYLKEFDNAHQGLTYQQRRTLYFASLGFQNKHIARLDGVTEDTIKSRLTAARRRLKAVNTTHAVAIAIRKGLLWN